MNKVRKIDLFAIGRVILRKIWLLVIFGLVGGVAAYVYTDHFVTPLYQASVSIYVNNTAFNDNAMGVSAGNLATAQRLVLTYVTMIKSDTVLEKVSEEIGGKVSAGGIRGMMSAASVNETEVFKVNITCGNPELAAEIANAVAAVAPGEISNFVNGSATKIVDYAKVPTWPISPNINNNTTMGALSGVIVAVLIILLQYLLDVRVKDETDLEQISSAPVLGVIPDFQYESKSDYHYNNYQQTEP